MPNQPNNYTRHAVQQFSDRLEQRIRQQQSDAEQTAERAQQQAVSAAEGAQAAAQEAAEAEEAQLLQTQEAEAAELKQVENNKQQMGRELFTAGNTLRGDSFNVGAFRSPMGTGETTTKTAAGPLGRANTAMLQKSAGKLNWVRNLFRGSSPDAMKLRDYGVGLATAGTMDRIFYRGDYATEGDYWRSMLTPSTTRALGLLAAGPTGAIGSNQFRRQWRAGKPREALTSGLKLNIGLPLAERAAVIGVAEMLPKLKQQQDLNKTLTETNIDLTRAKTNQILDTGGTTSDIPWGKLGIGAGILGTGALALHAWNKGRDQRIEQERNEIERERSVNPERLSLEIPSHKISDSMYNRIGREILFEDKNEKERKAQRLKSSAALSQADTRLNDAAYNAYLRSENTPQTGLWGFIRSMAPTISGMLGGPQLGTAAQKLTQSMRPLARGEASQFAQSKLPETARIIQRGGEPERPWVAGGTQVVPTGNEFLTS